MARKKWRSLLGIEHLSPEDITHILRLARRFDGKRARPLLRDRRIALLFYEASTRTRVSFEYAAKGLGASTAVILATASSIEKGESLIDTGRTLRAMDLDAIVVRHPSSGAPNVLARDLDIPIINAGDGMHEHPTQALLDAYTILRHKKKLAGLKVAIVGDIYHSRVARSGVFLLSKFGAHITLCGPPELVPDVASTLARGVRVSRYMDDALRGADVVMMLRVQKERLAGRKIDFAGYIANYQLTPERLRLARRDAVLMHPGPMVRGLELTSEVADGPQSVITQQVHNGVPVRMAALAHCMGVA
jgi:aspartate carbamoyltransferase catalytic subunit